ncbi:hypothetical protein PFISCL1PPCAC_5292, partial [Pristionchus fissidentatus]
CTGRTTAAAVVGAGAAPQEAWRSRHQWGRQVALQERRTLTQAEEEAPRSPWAHAVLNWRARRCWLRPPHFRHQQTRRRENRFWQMQSLGCRLSYSLLEQLDHFSDSRAVCRDCWMQPMQNRRR